MIPFLESVALAFSSKYSDLSEFSFVFPNKRSGSFFIKYLAANTKSAVVAPEIITISDLVTELAGLLPENRLNLIFRLFICYQSLLDDPSSVSFDNFRGWGETVLSDFDEIDMQLIDTNEIFKNIKDLKEINANFLTSEQLDIMEEYFGYNAPAASPSDFWKDFENVDPDSPRGKFLYIWQVLAPLYASLHKMLNEEGLTTQGGTYRKAYENVKSVAETLLPGRPIPDDSPLSRHKKMVFIGFNALSHSEFKLFSLLNSFTTIIDGNEEPFADFFWDASGPLLADKDNPAFHFINLNRKYLPSPEWSLPYISKSDVSSPPELIRVDAVPSNVAQIKVIGNNLNLLLSSIAEQARKSHPAGDGPTDEKELIRDYLKEAKVAIVLPNENLLQPLLYSLPEIIENPNLTMGYPLKQTAVVAFLTLFRRLQSRRVKSSESEPGFLTADFLTILSHPYSQVVLGKANIDNFIKSMAERHPFSITPKEVALLGDEAQDIFAGINADDSPEDVIQHIYKTLTLIDTKLSSTNGITLKGKMEHDHIATVLNSLTILKDAINTFKVEMHFTSLFFLIERMIANETVSFVGEPLEGLQVMGMLETRCLDFDYIFIPSVNDKILPKKARNRTFIPNSLRYAYKMPPANYQESIFSYYFFRLLSRAKAAYITYDSRTGDANSGGISRYLLQLRHFLAPENTVFYDCFFEISPSASRDEEVKKEGEIDRRLKLFEQDGIVDSNNPMYLSASSLSSFIACPMKFFFTKILKINDDNPPQESIDAVTTGNIVHEAMMNLYLPPEKQRVFLPDKEKVTITHDTIQHILENKGALEKLIIRLINKIHFNLPEDKLDRPLRGSAAFTLSGIVSMVTNILRYDLSQVPFSLHGCETSFNLRLPLPSGRCVNLTCAIDRIDRSEKITDAPLRIVDYKTGYVALAANSIESVFSEEAEGKNIFQLYLYALLLSEYLQANFPDFYNSVPHGIETEIYNVLKILRPEDNKSNPKHPVLDSELKTINSDYEDPFKENLYKTIENLLDRNIPFCRTANSDNCRFCSFKNLCYR